MTEPVTDPAGQEDVQPVPDTADSDEQRAADEQRAEEQFRAEHDFQEQQPVTVERSGPEQVDPAGQPANEGGLPYAQTADTSQEGQRAAWGEPSNTEAAQPIGATANESPTLPAGAQAGAAKAHAVLGHLVKVAQAAQNEIERYVPAELLSAAERDAMLFVRSIL